MSYIRADEALPRELVEKIQQYVSGTVLYVPSREKKNWGSRTDAKCFYESRNAEIVKRREAGETVEKLAEAYALSVKSIQRIVREAATENEEPDGGRDH